VTHHASIPLSLSLWVVLLVAFGSLACDEKLSDLAGPSPNLQPTFASVQHEIFEARDASGRAACTECHTDVGGRTPSGGLNLRHEVAYASLVGIASRNKAGAVRVIAGDADNSYIVHKLEGRPGIVGERMPRTGGPYLTEGQMTILKRWIATGANND
jgi:hypothetical protein